MAYGPFLSPRLQSETASGWGAARARYVMYVCTGQHPHSFILTPIVEGNGVGFTPYEGTDVDLV